MSTVDVNGRAVEVSNVDKVLFPDDGVTKGDVIDYYRRVADRVLPQLRDRPLVMRRFPDGIREDGFYQKDTPDHFPDWIRTVTLEKKEGGTVTHVVCDDAATLVYLADQGTIELHTLLAPAGRPDRPDRLVLDLDPSTDDLTPVVEGARVIRDLLDDLGVTGFVGSTGSRGVHVHVLLDGAEGFEAARSSARRLAEAVVATDPGRFTVEQSKQARGDRLFVDTLRNSFGQHAIAPYSLRARDGAPIAVPLTWEEATASSFDPRAVTIRNVFRRLGAQGDDPWSGMGRYRYSIGRISERLDRREKRSSAGDA